MECSDTPFYNNYAFKNTYSEGKSPQDLLGLGTAQAEFAGAVKWWEHKTVIERVDRSPVEIIG